MREKSLSGRETEATCAALCIAEQSQILSSGVLLQIHFALYI